MSLNLPSEWASGASPKLTGDVAKRKKTDNVSSLCLFSDLMITHPEHWTGGKLFSHINQTNCSSFFLGRQRSTRQRVWSLVENMIRTQVIYSWFLHPWLKSCFRFCSLNCVGWSLASRQEVLVLHQAMGCIRIKIWHRSTPVKMDNFLCQQQSLKYNYISRNTEKIKI